ncbi:Dehydrogenase reductase SDR member [Porites harrisoni]
MMVPAKQGLIVNVSSPGGLRYVLNVPYGVGKAACDRMAADMAVELREQNVACVSLWPGAVFTEQIKDLIFKPENEKSVITPDFFVRAEDATFSGKAVAWLAADPNIMNKTGRILVTAELGQEYGFKDVGGVQPASYR